MVSFRKFSYVRFTQNSFNSRYIYIYIYARCNLLNAKIMLRPIAVYVACILYFYDLFFHFFYERGRLNVLITAHNYCCKHTIKNRILWWRICASVPKSCALFEPVLQYYCIYSLTPILFLYLLYYMVNNKSCKLFCQAIQI